MPDWLTLLLPILGAIVVGALGGIGGFVAWRQFRHQQPIESHEAIIRSFERQIAWAEKRGDADEVKRLRREMEGQDEASRAQQGMRSRVSPGPLTLDAPTRLAPEELAELRSLLRASQPLLAFSVQDFYRRGNAYFNVGDYEQSLAAFDRAIDLRPDDPQAHTNRGEVLRRLGRHQEALAAHDRAITLRPDDPQAHSNRGAALGSLGRHQEGLAAYDRAIALRPDYPEAHNNRGSALGSLGRHQEGLAAHDRAIALRPDYPEAHSNRGAALNNLGRYEEALAACERAIALRPDFPDAHSNRAAALLYLGSADLALEACERALTLRPDLIGAVYNKACALSRLARWDEALEWLERAVDGDQRHREMARTDPDFQRLREHPEHGPRFWAIVGQQ